MSANTKIVVLRRKELLYTGIFAALGVLFIILLLMLLLPGKSMYIGWRKLGYRPVSGIT